jgi:hypothetical protein
VLRASLAGMRVAVIVGVSLLLAGCANDARTDSRPSQSDPGTTSTTRSAPPVTSTTAAAAPTKVPVAGAPISDVISWIEAGKPADPGAFHSATLDGATTQIGDGVAFVTAGTGAACMTNKYVDGELSCLLKLTNPPPRPPDFPTAWKNNWVDFGGTSVEIGSPHGDPGPFAVGMGAELPAGQTLAFGDYRCRADAAGLFCVNYAHQSAVLMSKAGVEPFGCLRQATPPPDIGLQFKC